MQRFDTNHDGYIDNEEARIAYPVFQSFVANAARKFNVTDPDQQYAIFIYLLSTGDLPITDRPEDGWLGNFLHQVVQGAWWIIHWPELKDKEFQTDRVQLLKLLGLLTGLPA